MFSVWVYKEKEICCRKSYWVQAFRQQSYLWSLPNNIFTLSVTQKTYKNTARGLLIFCFKYLLCCSEIDDAVLAKMIKIRDIISGQRFWKCADCDYSKRLKGDVFKHVERKHINITVACNMCELSYNSRQELKTHIKSKHPIVNWDWIKFCFYILFPFLRLRAPIERSEWASEVCSQRSSWPEVLLHTLYKLFA